MPALTVASKELADLFSVLSHPHRVRIILELRDGERDVKGLQAVLGISHSAVSQHLSVMRAHKVVAERREGRHVFYRACQPELYRWLMGGLPLIQGELRTAERVRFALEDARQILGDPPADRES
jgi:DNA-binding transcriptional ArsR family regulator